MDKKENKVVLLKNQKILLFILIIVIIFIICFVLTNEKIDSITNINKIFDEKYYDVKCVNEKCDYIVALKNDNNKDYKYYIYNYKGKKITEFKQKNDNNSETRNNISDVSSNYIIFKKVKKSSSEVTGYYLTDLKANKKYNSVDKLTYLTENLILITKKDNTYEILDKNGNIIYSNVEDVKTFNDNKIVLLKVNSSDIIINYDGKVLLEDYTVSKEIKDNMGKTLYLIIKDVRNNLFYYYNINQNKIVGSNFQNYIEKDKKGNLLITKVKNNILEKYILDKNGNQKKYIYENNKKYANEIKKLINNTKYYLYEDSIYKKNQNNVFVDNKEDKSFGVYDIKNDRYTLIYKYSKENAKSNVSKLDKEGYYQIVCKKGNCENNKSVIYNLKKLTTEFNLENDSFNISKYTSYEKGYKTIKLLDDNNVKYTLYDNDNKKIINSKKQIIIIDDNISYTNDSYSDDMLLYSVKKHKIINKEDEKGVKLNISKYAIYKYTTSNKTCIINNKSKIIDCINNNVDISLSGDLIKYIYDNKITMINVKKSKKTTYILSKNEKINDIKGNIIPLYRNTLFINNSSDNYIKVISNEGKIIKKIKNAEIINVKQIDEKNILIFTKKTIENKDYYGLYLAK